MKQKLERSLKSMKGITLIALVVTIIILIILAGVSLYLILGQNGIIKKATIADQETVKQTATEAMNLKITSAQINTYAEKLEMPTLQELADEFCNDNDFEYVELQSKKVASLPQINVGTNSSIFTKLKEYPYEFEINSSLQLASIDGVQVAKVPENDGDTIISMTKSELEKLIEDKVKEINITTSLSSTNTNYSEEEQIVGTWIDGTPVYQIVKIYDGPFGNGTNIVETGFKQKYDIKDLISIDGSIKVNASNKYAQQVMGNYCEGTSISDIGDLVIGLETGVTWKDAICIIKYTKTTDTVSGEETQE